MNKPVSSEARIGPASTGVASDLKRRRVGGAKDAESRPPGYRRASPFVYVPSHTPLTQLSEGMSHRTADEQDATFFLAAAFIGLRLDAIS